MKIEACNKSQSHSRRQSRGGIDEWVNGEAIQRMEDPKDLRLCPESNLSQKLLPGILADVEVEKKTVSL